MACSSNYPNCGDPSSAPVVPEPLTKIASVIGTIVAIIGVIGTVLKVVGAISVVEGVLTVAGYSIGGAAASGAVAGAAAAIAIIIVIGTYAGDRCVPVSGLPECIAGVITEIVESFNSVTDELLPFTAMHDRVDIVVKSRFWPIVESNNAFVFCTDQETPRRSEILRAYYYDSQVCQAATGAQVGAIPGAVAGVIAAAIVAAAIGCATVYLCIIALIVAVIVAAVATLVGALIGGQVAKESTPDSSPSDGSGTALTTGNLISVHGNKLRREHDSGANVLWWVSSTTLHGQVSATVSPPYSYCEIDEELSMDACPLPNKPR